MSPSRPAGEPRRHQVGRLAAGERDGSTGTLAAICERFWGDIRDIAGTVEDTSTVTGRIEALHQADLDVLLCLIPCEARKGECAIDLDLERVVGVRNINQRQRLVVFDRSATVWMRTT